MTHGFCGTALRRSLCLRAAMIVLLAGTSVPTTQVHAQFPGIPSRSDSDSSEVVASDSTRNALSSQPEAPDSPRAAMDDFLALLRTGRFDAAGAYLTVPDSQMHERAQFARKFKAVLDHHLALDIEDLSPLSSGNTADGLNRSEDQLGSIPLPDGRLRPVRIVRSAGDSLVPWRFSAATVRNIPMWYASLPDAWLLDHLPTPLVRTGPFSILWWQWIALPILLALAIVVGWVASKIFFGVAHRVVARTRSRWDNALLSSIERPMAVALALASFAMALPLISLSARAHDNVVRCVRAGFFVVFFWALWRLIDVARQVLSHSRWAQASTSSRALLPLATRVVKVLVLAIALVGLLSLLGYPVASLLAGLGLGGLALALAAQKTVENLFGAFSIGVDQPFREGDFVKVEDFVGTVEAVGLRATRFRTLDRTLISMPNGRLADMRLESFSARDRMRLATTIGLVYETTLSQMREVLAGWERVLRNHPAIWPDAVVVKFSGFGDSSLNVEVMAWFRVPEWSDFQTIRQDVLLEFMEVVEKAGTDFAFPTRTIHVASLPSTVPSPPSASGSPSEPNMTERR